MTTAATKKESNLAKKAMLVSLSIGVWSATKYDQKVSSEVAADHGAAHDAGRYRKQLLPPDSTSLDAVRKAATAAREFHYNNTLPWGQDGSRILTKEHYFFYVENMRKFRLDFEKQVSKFVDEYPKAIPLAPAFLGTMYNAKDYPNPASMAGNFKFDNLFLPMPDAKDFRVDLNEEDVNDIKRSIKAQAAQGVKAAMRDAWNQLYEAVSHAAESLGNPDEIFRDSLIGNLQRLVNVLPRLNVEEDAYFDQMASEVKTKLTQYTPKELRKDPEKRKNTATNADEILKMMSSYMNPAPSSNGDGGKAQS